PFAVVLLAALSGAGFLAETRAAERPRMDVTGALLFVAALGALVLGAVQGPQWGWTGPAVLGLLGGGVVLLAVFTRTQARGKAPLLDLSLVRDRRFFALCLVPVVTTFGFVTLLTYLPTYLVGAGGMSAARAGTVMLLLTGPVLAAPPLAGALVTRGVPPRALITLSLLLFAAGDGWLTVIEPGSSTWVIAPPLLLAGLGAGVSFGVNDGLAMSLVAPDRAGMAAGFLNTMRLGSEAIVIAVFGAVLVSLVGTRVPSHALAARVAAGEVGGGDRVQLAAAFTHALHLALWGLAAVSAVGAVVVHSALARPRRDAAVAAPAVSEPAAVPAESC
ncbi:MFS transporter, partial [Spirillospora sp. NPDC049652]